MSGITMNNAIMNDENMYQYFDALLYGDNSKLKAEWKREMPLEPYGLTDYDVNALLGSKSLLYEQEDAEKQICLLETMQKFLHEYVGIEGLEELFVNNYGTIENSIFLEHDGSGNPVHTREHAKHQMKNAFLGSVLLLEWGYLEDMVKNIYQAESMTTKYLVTQAYQALKEERLLDKGAGKPEKEWKDPENENHLLGKLEAMTYKIFMVSSMLHDIGYPLEFYLRSAQMLTDYPPYLHILAPAVKTEFAQIKSYLLGSQLFRQIDNQVIREKYLKNNHGVLSAISLLLHFYCSGQIYSLSSEERCIIEMSAIAIFHHTDKFQEGFRMVYLQDPISYMVRLCDDLQEWERFKLLISDKHNYLRCENCGRLIREKGGEYECASCKRKYTKITQIANRKVNYICMCDRLLLDKKSRAGEDVVHITVEFDCMKQIEILLDDYTAVKRREADLKKVQKFVQKQSMNPAMEIDFFVSNNPLLLIERMIEESGKTDTEIQEWIKNYYSRKQEQKKRENLEKFYQDYLRKKAKNPFGGTKENPVESNFLKYEEPVREYVLEYYGEIYSLYQMLHSEEK